MTSGKTAGAVFLAMSVVPLVFLVYTLTHQKALNISFLHPSVIVESILFLAAVTAGIILLFRS